jgi:hypothetical protein
LTLGGDEHQRLAEQFKSRIQNPNQAITELQNQIAAVSHSIHYAGGNCVSNCVEWNQRQQRKLPEVDTMRTQLEEAERGLDQMREAARQQGFGSSLSDPDQKAYFLVLRHPSQHSANLLLALSNFHSPQNRGFVRN